MLLTITTTAPQATDLGYLLHKNPGSLFQRELPFGVAWVFYPEASQERTTCALLVEVDPIGLVRRPRGALGMDQYVNDRPYVASSMLAVALSRCFGSAMSGSTKEKVDRLFEEWPLEVTIPAVACQAGENLIRRFFEPLGYEVQTTGYPLDDRFAEWGESAIYTVTLRGQQTVRTLLNHLYVLLPALDRGKHYYVGDDEVDKLVRKGNEWLANHAERHLIARRYLKNQASLAHKAISQLTVEQEETDANQDTEEQQLESVIDPAVGVTGDTPEANPTNLADATGDVPAAPQLPEEFPDNTDPAPRLHELRLNTVLAAIRDPRRAVRSLIDLGCGDGKFLQLAIRERQLTRIVGMDVSPRELDRCQRRLKLDRLPQQQRERIALIHGSLVYRDDRLAGFDAAVLIEVIEHLDPARLAACERVVFEFARPRTVFVTTPNGEYNVVWETLPAGKMRHGDHRFEWNRAQFHQWCQRVSERFGYSFETLNIGPPSPEHPTVGTASQMAIFMLNSQT